MTLDANYRHDYWMLTMDVNMDAENRCDYGYQPQPQFWMLTTGTIMAANYRHNYGC